MLYMLTAGKKALADGGISEDIMNELDKSRCGVLIGSAMGGMKVALLPFFIFCFFVFVLFSKHCSENCMYTNLVLDLIIIHKHFMQGPVLSFL